MAIKNRLFAGLGAALFLITSSALTIAVIVSTSQSSKTTAATCSEVDLSGKNTDSVGSKLQGYTPASGPLSRLQYFDIKVGSGAVAQSKSTITAGYIGALADTGVIFDTSQSHGGPVSFPLNGVIVGWQLGIPGMKVGGTRQLCIPSALAYGSQGTSTIPANSDLVFLVTLDSVKN